MSGMCKWRRQCEIYFMGFSNDPCAGIQALAKMLNGLHEFQWGQICSIDIPGEIITIPMKLPS